MIHVIEFADQNYRVRAVKDKEVYWFLLTDVIRVIMQKHPDETKATIKAYCKKQSIPDRLVRFSKALSGSGIRFNAICELSQHYRMPEFAAWMEQEVFPRLTAHKEQTIQTPADTMLTPTIELLHETIRMVGAVAHKLESGPVTGECREAQPVIPQPLKPTGCMLADQLAQFCNEKNIQYRTQELLDWLYVYGYIIGGSGNNRHVATQYAIDQGLIQLDEQVEHYPDGHLTLIRTPAFTGKGKQHFVDEFATKKRRWKS